MRHLQDLFILLLLLLICSVYTKPVHFSIVGKSLLKQEPTLALPETNLVIDTPIGTVPCKGKFTTMTNTLTPDTLSLRGLGITTGSLQLVFYYFLLYLFTVIYNISNKRVLNVLPLPATMATVQLFLGIPLFLPVWVVKPPRNIGQIPRAGLVVASISHALGNLATIYSLGAGAVSFTHVVKSAEPVFAAVLAAILNRSYYAPQVYLTLLPIVAGVALASCTELTFTWLSFTTAMVSNFFYQLRIVVSKPLIVTAADGSKLSGSNLFRIITLLAAVFMLPIALYLEGNNILPAWKAATSANSGAANAILVDVLVSGFSYYMYNEISFWILDLVQPVTHAVGNTIKRVVLIVAAVLVFHAPVTLEGGAGSLIAIAGSLFYALAMQKYHPAKPSQ